MKSRSANILEIHFAVLLFGLAGLFGKILNFNPVIITLGRVFFAFLSLLLLAILKNQNIKLKGTRIQIFLALSGIMLAFHWILFFKSIQVSTIAIGLISYSTFPVITTFIEPYFFREKLKMKSIITALISLVGIALVVPDYHIENNITQGAIWGILSGASFASIQTFNRKFVQEIPGTTIALYQTGVASVVLLPFLFIYSFPTTKIDIMTIILLGVVFTAVAHSLFISGLKNIKAKNAGIIALLEPVYGIIVAAFILKEYPSFRLLGGGMIILFAAFYVTFFGRKD